MMLKYAIKLLRRNKLTNIFVILQIAMTLVLAIVCISSVMSKIEKYLPLRQILSSQGECVFTNGSYLIFSDSDSESGNTAYMYDDIKKCSSNIKEVYGCQKYILKTNNKDCDVYSYTSNMLNLYSPKMSSGSWKSLNNEKSVVMSYNEEYRVGDLITLNDNSGIKYQFRVTGIIAENEKILTTTSGCDAEKINDFRDLYQNITDIGNKENIVYFLNDSTIEECNSEVSPCGASYVIYKDGLSEQQKIDTHKKLTYMGICFDLQDKLNKDSISYIGSDIKLILPIAICILILALISSVSATAINAKTNLRTFSVLTICGGEWDNTIFICFFNSLFNNIMGLITAFFMCILIKQTHIFGNVLLDINKTDMIACLFIILINIVFSVILPIFIISNKSPKSILYDNN